MQITGETAAVVTGGASGLGEASARALAAAGLKVAIFDLNAEKGEAIATEIGGVFCNVNITSEESVVAGFDQARAAHGQERVLVHCAQTSRGGKTVGKDRETGGFKRFSTEDYEYSILGILVASYRLASLSAFGMASLEPLEDGERGVITLTASAAAQDAQVGQVGYGSGKAGVNGLVLPMAWLKHVGADHAKLNVNGGAIALGHPLGASGTKLMATLVYALKARGKRYGLQTMCEGGGVANVTIIEAL